jgi:chromosome partitioning protein
MATIITIANQKGGVAKTTTVQHLGYALREEHRKRVLLIDSDPQANLTSVFNIVPGELRKTVFDVLKGEAALSEVIIEEDPEGPTLDIAPSNIGLSRAEIELISEINATYLLRSAITSAVTEGPGSYDYILIDCPPSLGILTINSLACADYVIVPIQPEMYALEGLEALETTISKVRQRANPELKVLGWVITLHDGRTRIHRDVTDLFRKKYGSDLFQTVISVNTTIREAQAAKKTVIQYDASRTGAMNYLTFADEVVKRVGA